MRKVKEAQPKYIPGKNVWLWALMGVVFALGAVAMVYCAVTLCQTLVYLAAAGICLLLSVISFAISRKLKFKGLKQFYISRSMDKLIAKDSGTMDFTIQVFNSMPCRGMLRWISDLNGAAGKYIRKRLEQDKEEEKKEKAQRKAQAAAKKAQRQERADARKAEKEAAEAEKAAREAAEAEKAAAEAAAAEDVQALPSQDAPVPEADAE